MLLAIGWGLYYNTSRPWVKEVLGYSYNFLFLLMAVEYAPLLLALIAGIISDYIGRIRAIYIGLLQSLAFIAAPFLDLKTLPILILIASLASILPWVNIVALSMVIGRRSGTTYSRIALGSSLGFGLSGVITLVLDALCREFDVLILLTYIIASISTGISTILVLIVAKRVGEYRDFLVINFGDLLKFITKNSKQISIVILSFTSIFLGVLIAWNALSLKLYGILNNVGLFGLISATIPAFTAAISRPSIGKFIDLLGPMKSYLVCLIAYLLYLTAMFIAPSHVFIILWFIPIYPLLDTSTYILSAHMFPLSMQGSASGLVIMGQGIAGLLALLTNLTELNYYSIYLVVLLSIIIALISSLIIKPIR